MARPIVNLYRLGRLPYVKGLSVQQVLFDRLKARVITQIGNRRGLDCAFEQESSSKLDTSSRENSLVLVEHEPVYTIGLRNSQYDGGYEKKLLDGLDKHNLQADFLRTKRGGLITFHGPGQLVAYPILYLGDFKRIKNRSVKAYVNSLEATIIDTLARVGLNGAHTVQEYPGVWLDEGQRKVAFVGIACKRYVTMHGISINCNCDLEWFDHIVSCGIEDKAITSIHREMLSKTNQFRSQYQHFKMGAIDGDTLLTSATKKSPSDLDHNYLEKPSESLEKCVNVGHVSKAFCESFSQIFDCSLLEKQHELDHEIAELII